MPTVMVVDSYGQWFVGVGGCSAWFVREKKSLRKLSTLPNVPRIMNQSQTLQPSNH